MSGNENGVSALFFPLILALAWKARVLWEVWVTQCRHLLATVRKCVCAGRACSPPNRQRMAESPGCNTRGGRSL